MERLKSYILIKDSAPPGLAIVAACHATLAMYLKFSDDPETQAWLDPANGAFYKVVCQVSDAEFEKAKQAGHCVVMTESAWEGKEIALAFRPRGPDGWPKGFKFFRKWAGV